MFVDDLHKITSEYPSSSCMPAWALETIIFLSLTTKPWNSSAEKNSCYSIFERSLKIVSQEVKERLCKESLIYKDEAGDLKANFPIIEKKLKEKGMSLRKNIGEHAYARHLI